MINCSVNIIDNDDVVHKKVVLKLFENATVSHLLRGVCRYLNIETTYLRIFDKDNNITALDKPLSSIIENDEYSFTAKHSFIDSWHQYKKYAEIALQKNFGWHEKAVKAESLYEHLNDNYFFCLYKKFDDFCKENHPAVANYAVDLLTVMDKEAFKHFYNQHIQNGGKDKHDIEYKCYRRPEEYGWDKLANIVEVKLHGQTDIKKYNVKFHHYANRSYQSIDIIEMFFYKILELIKVGPPVQFIIPDSIPHIKTYGYIATEWCDTFTSLDSVSDEEVDEEILVELQLVNVMLFLSDLHRFNVGFWSDSGKAAVVDFRYTVYSKPFYIADFLILDIGDGWPSPHLDKLKFIDEKERLSMIKNILNRWNLIEKSNDAYVEMEKIVDLIKSKNELLIYDDWLDRMMKYIGRVIDAIKSNLKMLEKHMDSLNESDI